MRMLLSVFFLLTMVASVSVSALSITAINADCDPGVANFGGGAFACGSSVGDVDRTNSGNVNLGAADGQFYSLGLSASGDPYGGAALFSLDPAFTGDLTVVEVTFGAGTSNRHAEAADVFVAKKDSDGNYDPAQEMFIGTLNNANQSNNTANLSLSFEGVWDFLLFRDSSKFNYSETSSTDGFDIDSISVQPVPIPAAAWLFISALSGLMFTRRSS